MNVFIINFDDKKVEEVNYSDLITSFAEETTTPHGISRTDHIRERQGYLIDNEEFVSAELIGTALETGKNIDGEDISIKEAIRYEAWSWGHQGSFPKFIKAFDTREEADKWLFEQAEHDFNNSVAAPVIYCDLKEAEERLNEGF